MFIHYTQIVMLTLTDGVEKLSLTKDESLRLELKLNISPFAVEWKTIGDILFEYANDVLGEDYTLVINSDQHNYLLYLHVKTN